MRHLADRHGMALLLDAMVFLTVMTVVSVSLLTLLRTDQGTDGEAQRYVERVHEVLLRSTLELEGGAPMSLADAAEICLFSQDDVLRTSIKDQVNGLLLAYFDQGMMVRWRVGLGNASFEVSVDGMTNVPEGRSTYVSEVGGSNNNDQLLFRLTVSYR